MAAALGRLAEALAAGSYESYPGIDFCREAVARARRLSGERIHFRVADPNRWSPRRRFSIILIATAHSR